VRDPRKLEGRDWPGVEVVVGDVLDRETLQRALRGCHIGYYLVHSMGGKGGDFIGRDRTGARNMAEAAALSSLERIIYLGGLGDRTSALSPHLHSRNEVGQILASGPVPVTEFRAAMIMGSGSASFDMMHALVNRLPVMVAPKWVKTLSQPISVRDVLQYLVDCLAVPDSVDAIIDIGGPDVLSYKEMMERFARLLHLRRWIVVVPVLTPGLSSLWMNLVTPISSSIARPLIEGLKSEMVCENDLARKLFSFEPRGFDRAVERALRRMQDVSVETTWTDATGVAGKEEFPLEGESQVLSDTRRVGVSAPAERLYMAVVGIGGANGWYYADFLWKIRGFLDKMIGGVGLRRGRRHPSELVAGEALDFWRVEAVVPGERVLLRAEMKVPGRAWLEFGVTRSDENRSVLTQTALFYPRGVWGLLYWYGIYPIHVLVFRGMARGIARRAENP
jgi:uncharacterized protein YbjT (DUF2867 family)